MKTRTKDEVLAFMRDAIPPEYDFREVNYDARQTRDGWDLTVEQMYEYVPFNAELLFKVCEFFDTMNVNDSRYSSSGCETCDYGSSYVLTLHVLDGKPFPRPHSETQQPSDGGKA